LEIVNHSSSASSISLCKSADEVPSSLEDFRCLEEADSVRSFRLAKKGLFALPAYAANAHTDLHRDEGINRKYSRCGDPSEKHHY